MLPSYNVWDAAVLSVYPHQMTTKFGILGIPLGSRMLFSGYHIFFWDDILWKINDDNVETKTQADVI